MKNNKVYKYLTSIRFAIPLMVIIALLCVIYTVIPQNEPFNVYTERYGSGIANVITTLSLDHVLTSVWMYVSGILFSLNLGICTFRRFGFAIRSTTKRVSAFGSPVLHVGLCVILFGAILSLFTGRKLYYEIPVGESAEIGVRSETFKMTVEDFTIELYEDNVTPKQYRTALSFEDEDGTVSRDETYVNGPVKHKGVTILQQAYGWMIDATVSTGTTSRTLHVKDGASEELFGKGANDYTLTFHFFPDYDEEKGIDAVPGTVDTNPHILWILNKGDETVTASVAKLNETQTIMEPLTVTFDAYGRYTGLQAKYDPGIPVIFAGFFLVLAGLILRYVFGKRTEKEEVKKDDSIIDG